MLRERGVFCHRECTPCLGSPDLDHDMETTILNCRCHGRFDRSTIALMCGTGTRLE
jgi:hypothetical protein